MDFAGSWCRSILLLSYLYFHLNLYVTVQWLLDCVCVCCLIYMVSQLAVDRFSLCACWLSLVPWMLNMCDRQQGKHIPNSKTNLPEYHITGLDKNQRPSYQSKWKLSVGAYGFVNPSLLTSGAACHQVASSQKLFFAVGRSWVIADRSERDGRAGDKQGAL